MESVKQVNHEESVIYNTFQDMLKKFGKCEVVNMEV